MQKGIIIALFVLGIAAWVGGLVSVIAGNRSFYRWHRPLFEAGVLPPNGFGPAFTTWRRLLGSQPEPDPAAEAYRSSAKRWFLRLFGLWAAFAGCVGLAVLVHAL